ncbi:MAG: stage III sporulation protein AF [Lachnospiraceae bacterium]|nr:stage III sporulation protein AF [Lachnospiraceae bacterium]
MLSIVKEVGIFVVIAQAILYFVPSENYAKYVKVLIGIMMVAKLISPIFSMLSGEGITEFDYRGEAFWESMEKTKIREMEGMTEEKIYENIRKEMKEKLNNNPMDGYVVEDVYIEETKDGTGKITILVQNEGAEKKGVGEEVLRKHYQELLKTEYINLQIK